ncbi:hypothetical protein KP509_32G005200 [Ceratopteris richardii]|uniref:Protein root UVB sensitive 6 n=1 Tax=Ceratopteris richardii TaxID=49495 RepID=A0A8T2QR08_CERRI|nr:hypothetical protein KP509_32G005200 [Ceratopteris richardii]KAH7286393.1 hypothetical protein KP509_32G005200 [Ceratopteris richardii]KAH7286394.1 hypothetical protein KP509_32G005200 [Ceratopteris richardii]KAH7286395.1 hypothetical protein KP509_32G005200 [Ceratopteris richardii]KAH7286396.1 hypothetical protein KP509_32G005200 [Ceratopteris richardii]
MPTPVPHRSISAPHQQRFHVLNNDDKRATTLNCPVSPSTFDHTSSATHISFLQGRQSGQEILRIRNAMEACAQSQCIDDLPFYQESIHVQNGERSRNGGRSTLQEKLPKSSSKRNGMAKSSSVGEVDELLCVETTEGGSQWKYFPAKPCSGSKASFRLVNTKANQNPIHDIMDFLRSCVVPEGYPESVSSSYAPYMHWRALKYFFGGAMSVFTTRSLLHAVGVSKGATSSAVAANWVIKDGAGRVGKMLFARHGKKFDCDMKQLRFMGDLLMEFGAAVELATAAAPTFFLPLACLANVAKNVAAVTSTSTRAPIYKAFSQRDNIGDVTAKGECVSNIADLLGTGLGIYISRRNPSLMATFIVLSCGYLCCSYQEVKSVVLPTLNRARFGVAVQSFLYTGTVPSISAGNKMEKIFSSPLSKDMPIVLGARVNEAFDNPNSYLAVLPIFKRENYLVTHDQKKRQIYVILKEGANSEDVLRATFHGQVLANILQKPLPSVFNLSGSQSNTENRLSLFRNICQQDMSVEAIIRESCKHVPELFDSFKLQADSQGWMLGESLLNPGITRLRTCRGC